MTNAAVTPTTTTTTNNSNSNVEVKKDMGAADSNIKASSFLQRRWMAITMVVMTIMMFVLFGLSIRFYKEASDLSMKEQITMDAMSLQVEFLRNATIMSSIDGNMTTMDENSSNIDGSNGNGRELYVCPDADNVLGASRVSGTDACNRCNTYLTRLHGCVPGCRRSFDQPYRILRGGNIYCDCHCGWEGTYLRLYS